MRRIITLLILVPLAAAPAQEMWHLGLAGGVSVPTGSLSNGAELGWNALGTIALSPLMQPLGLRADVAWNQFSSKGTGRALSPGNQTLLSVTGNATYRVPLTSSAASPYVIGGLGWYRFDCEAQTCIASNHFGWNAGVGTALKKTGVQMFLEARYHHTEVAAQSAAWVPITLGFMF